MNMDKSTNLVLCAKKGDKSAYSELYEIYYTDFYKLALCYTRNVSDAEDVLQNTFLIAYKKLYSLKNDELFKVWTTKILINEAKKILNLRKKHTTSSIDEISEKYLYSYELETSNIELMEMIHKLKNQDQKVIKLRFFAGLSISEIAKFFHCSESTVKSRLYRAIKKIEEMM